MPQDPARPSLSRSRQVVVYFVNFVIDAALMRYSVRSPVAVCCLTGFHEFVMHS